MHFVNKSVCRIAITEFYCDFSFRIPTPEFSLRFQGSYLTPTSAFRLLNSTMVGVAQLVEPQVVALVVVGSSPITHPIFKIKPGRKITPGYVFTENF